MATQWSKYDMMDWNELQDEADSGDMEAAAVLEKRNKRFGELESRSHGDLSTEEIQELLDLGSERLDLMEALTVREAPHQEEMDRRHQEEQLDKLDAQRWAAELRAPASQPLYDSEDEA